MILFVFLKVYGLDEDERFNYFAWPKNESNTLLAAVSNGDLLVVDLRSR